MTNVLETKIQHENQAADGRFFISSEIKPTPLIRELIDNIDIIAETSREATEKIRAISDEQYAIYIKKLSEITSGMGNLEAQNIVGQIQSSLEEASRFQDASAAIRGAGTRIAEHLKENFPRGFNFINDKPYWITADCTGKPQFCGAGDDGESVIVFGTLAFPHRENGRQACLEDYVRLINDVEAATA